MNKPLISIVVPIYNVEAYLVNTVESILKQSYANLEVILVDDGSTDSSGKISDDLAKYDKRIRVVHKKNGGLSDARNIGIEMAEGKYLGFVDGDDFIDENMYERLYLNLIENNANISVCDKDQYYDQKKQFVYNQRDTKLHTYTREEALIKLNLMELFDVSACDKLFEKKLFDEIKFPLHKKSEDTFVMYKLFDKCMKIVYDPIPMYHYRQRENSITRNPNISLDVLEACLTQINFFKEKYPKIVYAAYTALAFNSIWIYNSYIKYCVNNPEVVKQLKKNVKKSYFYVLKNNYLSTKKKLICTLFYLSVNLYKFVWRRNESKY